MKRNISENGIRLIKNFEGCRLTAYKPVNTEKYWTIGYGHYGADVREGMTITQEQADKLFLSDVVRYVEPVNKLNLKLNQNQFDALVSFCYNCGAGNLRKLCSGKTLTQIAASLPNYNKAGGVVLKGLVRRRQAELELFNKEDEEMQQEIVRLEAKIADLEIQIKRMNEMMNMIEIPEWAKFAVDNAVKNGVIQSPVKGSMDFFRLITILQRANIFDKKV